MALSSIYLPTTLSQLGFNPQSIDPTDQLNRAAVASALTLWIGIIFLIMSFFRLASLIHFLSFSVMCGFTTYVLTYVRTLIDSTFQHLSITPHPNNTKFSAAGLFLGLTQLKFILDLHPPHEHYRVNQLLWLGAWFLVPATVRQPPLPYPSSNAT